MTRRRNLAGQHRALSDDDAARIRRLYHGEGLTTQIIATRFRVSRATIRKVVDKRPPYDKETDE